MQVFSKPVNVYVDTPLRDIVNRHSERVKRVGLLVRAVGLEDKILPALSTPFMVSFFSQTILSIPWSIAAVARRISQGDEAEVLTAFQGFLYTHLVRKGDGILFHWN